MAVNDISSKEEVKVNNSQAVVDGTTKVEEATSETLAETSAKDCEGTPTTDLEVKAEPKGEHEIEINQEEENQEVTSKVKVEDDEDIPMEDFSDLLEPIDDKRGIKRRASTALSDIDESEEFKGFEKIEECSLEDYSKVVERLEAEVTAAVKSITPLRSVRASSITSLRAIKRSRRDTDGSRSSSALSSRSDGDGTGSTDSSMSPVGAGGSRGRRSTVEMSSPLLRVPLERGWKRELVYRAATDPHSKRNADIYYYTPAGKKLRSNREISENLAGTGLNLDNFSFFKEPLGIDDPEKEIIRDAKVMRRADSPVPAPVAPVEGKRTPKPKPPKGASPEPPAVKSPPAKLKVKSVGSRLNNTASTPTAVTPKQVRKQQPQGTPATVAAAPTTTSAQASTPAPAATARATPAGVATVVDNNNSSAWKKPSDKARGRIANGASSPPAHVQSPRRRGRPRVDSADHFVALYKRAKAVNYNVAVQIFQYLGMRDLARCARVCKLWRELASTPALWRHVRMKNSHVSDWGGLCSALKRHGTKWLDLRKMLLPQNDTVFWDQFTEHIGTIDTLERLELCRCPARAVEEVCRRIPTLRALIAPAIRDAKLDPAPLAKLPRLEVLKLKSLTGLSLSRDLRPLSALTRLQHLSLTSIKELGWCACEVVGQLEQLESLELGECSFHGSFASALARLSRLRRLRLERGVAHCAAPALLRVLATLPHLTRLELVNFDVTVGFDDALAECKNIQRLLIIPTYVSQSATTNNQVLSGVLQLRDTLTHLMWGVTIELLRVTELFIDQCEAGGDGRRRDVGECIPVLKPVPGYHLPLDHRTVAGPPQVEILPIPMLQQLLSTQLPNTKLKLLRIPFHATWRQSLTDFQ